MLNGGTLDGSTISVTSDEVATPSLANVQPVKSTAQTPAEVDGHDIEQEEKPRSAVVAEYLAHGYALSDTAIERAIAADKRELSHARNHISGVKAHVYRILQNTASRSVSSTFSRPSPTRSKLPHSLTSIAPAQSCSKSTRSVA